MKTRREGKRWVAWLLIVAMLVSTVCIDGLQTKAASSKKTVTKAGITYQVTVTGKKTAKVVKAKKTITKAEIPSAIKINGVSYKVTAVAKDAFKNCTKLKKITIGKNVTSIGAKVTLSGVTYQVTSASSKTAKVTKAKTTITKAAIPATVKIKGVSYDNVLVHI